MMKDEQLTQTIPTMQVARPSSTLVIGLGNPILGDDGVGWKVVEELQSKIANRKSEIEMDFLSLGGLSLMERMLSYERVIIVDSMETRQHSPGAVSVFPLSSLQNPNAGHSASAHDTSLMTALETARAMGLPVPTSIEIVAIEAENMYEFTEKLSPAIARAVPQAVQAVMDLLKEAP